MNDGDSIQARIPANLRFASTRLRPPPPITEPATRAAKRAATAPAPEAQAAPPAHKRPAPESPTLALVEGADVLAEASTHSHALAARRRGAEHARAHDDHHLVDEDTERPRALIAQRMGIAPLPAPSPWSSGVDGSTLQNILAAKRRGPAPLQATLGVKSSPFLPFARAGLEGKTVLWPQGSAARVGSARGVIIPSAGEALPLAASEAAPATLDGEDAHPMAD